MSNDTATDTFLTGKVAFVSGGLSGVGLAIAKSLAVHGARVAVGSRRAGQGDGADLNQQFHVVALDVQDGLSVSKATESVEAKLGPVDILVNAAGITAEQGVVGHSDALWHQILDTNLSGAFRLTRAVLPGMIGRGWGRIINIGSTAATVGWMDNPAYCASKAGLLGLTRCVALEGAPHGVGCTMISPTWVETDLLHSNTAEVAEREGKGRTSADIVQDIRAQNPQKRIIQPGEVAALATFLCRDEAFGLSMDNIQITGGALW
ncbi:SDR family NAD(P)-dependent oxidoreductase [Roseovarius sp. Pro17]|uniref:SDR family NAD(P)-dependent oxidoreductase n=1 Tax=Roseovarius sp. Pro17 TaxID=3108175 RepID=UPI002D77BC44|nr:SDR family NAD(P)-dependent oxidoreductase [Roseovarius sp. Pro17]